MDEIKKKIWAERLDKTLLWLTAIAISVAAFGFFIYVRSNTSTMEATTEVYGVLRDSTNQGVWYHSLDLRVQLESGALVRATGIENVPGGYKGKVKLIYNQSLGESDHYYIVGPVK